VSSINSAAFEVQPGLNENGNLVVGESIGDLGGLTIAYAALKKSMEGKPRPADIDGFSPEQRFFLGWAQVWAENERPEFERLMVATNPHPVGRFRVIGPLSNMPAFAQAYQCRKAIRWCGRLRSAVRFGRSDRLEYRLKSGLC